MRKKNLICIVAVFFMGINLVGCTFGTFPGSEKVSAESSPQEQKLKSIEDRAFEAVHDLEQACKQDALDLSVNNYTFAEMIVYGKVQYTENGSPSIEKQVISSDNYQVSVNSLDYTEQGACNLSCDFKNLTDSPLVMNIDHLTVNSSLIPTYSSSIVIPAKGTVTKDISMSVADLYLQHVNVVGKITFNIGTTVLDVSYAETVSVVTSDFEYVKEPSKENLECIYEKDGLEIYVLAADVVEYTNAKVFYLYIENNTDDALTLLSTSVFSGSTEIATENGVTLPSGKRVVATMGVYQNNLNGAGLVNLDLDSMSMQFNVTGIGVKSSTGLLELKFLDEPST